MLLVVKAFMEGSHVIVFLLLFHLEQLGQVRVIRVALEISCIGTANCGSYGLGVSQVVSVYILEHLHEFCPLIQVPIRVGALKLENLLLPPSKHLHSVLILLCRIIEVNISRLLPLATLLAPGYLH